MSRIRARLIPALSGALLLSVCSPGKPDTPRADNPPAANPPGSAPAGGPPAPATGEWTVTPNGVGPVQFGMPVADARRALGDSLGSADAACRVVAPAGVPAGLTLMIENGRVVRADVESDAVATDHGVKVGMSEVVLKERYGDSVSTTPHKYDPNGHFITFTPSGPDASRLRVVFETDGTRVVRYHAGVLPAAEYVERCG